MCRKERVKQRLETLLFCRASTGLDTQEELELKALLKVYPEISLTEYETIAAATDIALSKNMPMPSAIAKVLAQDVVSETGTSLRAKALKKTKYDENIRLLSKKRAQLSPINKKQVQTRRVLDSGHVNPFDLHAGKPKQIKAEMEVKTMHTAPIDRQGYTYRFNSLLMVFLGLFVFSGVAMWWWFERPNLHYNLGHHQSMQEERALLLQRAAPDDLIQGRWLHTINPLTSKVQGDIIWSATEQRGYMRFTGLPVARHGHYELWLYDYTQANLSPVLGKRFEIKQSRQETIIPFSPDTEVRKPYKFVVILAREDAYRSVQNSQVLLMVQP